MGKALKLLIVEDESSDILSHSQQIKEAFTSIKPAVKISSAKPSGSNDMTLAEGDFDKVLFLLEGHTNSLEANTHIWLEKYASLADDPSKYLIVVPGNVGSASGAVDKARIVSVQKMEDVQLWWPALIQFLFPAKPVRERKVPDFDTLNSAPGDEDARKVEEILIKVLKETGAEMANDDVSNAKAHVVIVTEPLDQARYWQWKMIDKADRRQMHFVKPDPLPCSDEMYDIAKSAHNRTQLLRLILWIHAELDILDVGESKRKKPKHVCLKVLKITGIVLAFVILMPIVIALGIVAMFVCPGAIGTRKDRRVSHVNNV